MLLESQCRRWNTVLVISALGAVLFFLCVSKPVLAETASRDKPNLLFILADDLH